MKKLLTITMLVAASVSVFGQGQVQMQNLDSVGNPSIRSPVWLDITNSGTALSGTDTQFRAALLGGPTSGTPAFIPLSLSPSSVGSPNQGNLNLLASPNTAATWVTFRTGGAAGFVAVGTDAGRDGGAFASTITVQLVSWNGGFTTWAAAYAAWIGGQPGIKIGASNPINVTLPLNSTDTTATRLVGLQQFAIVPGVPEPSSLALAGLGIASLLALRRRK
jgi:hypothetical protein